MLALVRPNVKEESNSRAIMMMILRMSESRYEEDFDVLSRFEDGQIHRKYSLVEYINFWHGNGPHNTRVRNHT